MMGSKKNYQIELNFFLKDEEEPLSSLETCAGFGGGLNDCEAFEEPRGFVPPD